MSQVQLTINFNIFVSPEKPTEKSWKYKRKYRLKFTKDEVIRLINTDDEFFVRSVKFLWRVTSPDNGRDGKGYNRFDVDHYGYYLECLSKGEKLYSQMNEKMRKITLKYSNQVCKRLNSFCK